MILFKEIPRKHLIDMFGVKWFKSHIWNKYALKEIHSLYPEEAKGLTTYLESFKPSDIQPLNTPTVKVDTILDLDTTYLVPKNSKMVWLYPRVIYELYKQTGIWYFKKQLRMPVIATIQLPPYPVSKFTDQQIIDTILEQKNEHILHKNILNLAYDEHGLTLAAKEIVPEEYHHLKIEELPKPSMKDGIVQQALRVTRKNKIYAYLDIFQASGEHIKIPDIEEPREEQESLLEL